MQEGMEGNPAAGTIKNVSRGFAALTIPFTAGFAKVHVVHVSNSYAYFLFPSDVFVRKMCIKGVTPLCFLMLNGLLGSCSEIGIVMLIT